MIRHDRRARLFATGLSALAGYVDAVGYIALGGFFVSFMSGNTTRLAVGLFARASDVALAAGLIALFVSGVVLGSLAGRVQRNRQAVILSLVAMLLAIGAAFGTINLPLAAAAAMALAMGAENAVFERDGEVQIGLTYMTGTLVKMGQRMAAALAGQGRWDWVPYALLWAGLASGAVLGAFASSYLGLDALWLAALVALFCAAGSTQLATC